MKGGRKLAKGCTVVVHLEAMRGTEALDGGGEGLHEHERHGAV
jgi:hypothetical protein